MISTLFKRLVGSEPGYEARPKQTAPSIPSRLYTEPAQSPEELNDLILVPKIVQGRIVGYVPLT